MSSVASWSPSLLAGSSDWVSSDAADWSCCAAEKMVCSEPKVASAVPSASSCAGVTSRFSLTGAI